MTRRILLPTVFLCVIFGGVAAAADISGNWSGTMQMGDNPISLTYAFKQDGDKVTGTVTTPQGQAIPLSDGKIAGEKLSFYVQVDMGGNPTKFSSEGVLKGDDYARSTMSEGGPDMGPPMVLKRVSEDRGRAGASTQRRREHRDEAQRRQLLSFSSPFHRRTYVACVEAVCPYCLSTCVKL
jgi:hypothetical protein